MCGGLRRRTWPLVKANVLDLSRKSSAELVELLSHRNDWYARQARRLLAERCDQSVVPALTTLALDSDDERLALQGLWSLYVTGCARCAAGGEGARQPARVRPRLDGPITR